MLNKKMFRDIKTHKSQFFSIFLMAFLGVFVFTGITAEYCGLENSVNDYYTDTNLADSWVYGEITDDFQDKVNDFSSTQNSQREAVIETVGDFDNSPEITLHFLEDDDISKFHITKGEEFNLSDEDGIWIDEKFADAKNLDIGDNITVDYNGLELTKEIKGIGCSPEYVFEQSENTITPDFNKIGYAYLSYKAFPTDITYNVLLVDHNSSAKAFEDQLSDELSGDYTSVIAQEDHPSVKQFAAEIDQHKMIADIFPVLFILIAFLTLLTTMTRIINNQRTQIGILKALGFKNKTIIGHYMGYGFWLVLVGSILGLIVGPLTLPYLFYPSMSSFYIVPEWRPGFSWSFVPMVLLMVLLSILVSYISTRSIAKENPADSIRPKSPKISSSGFVEKLKIWKKCGFNIRWNYRDAKRNKLRAIMTIVGVMGCTILLIAAFGCYDSMNDLKAWEYGDINHYESKLVINDTSDLSAIESIASDVNGKQIMESAIELKHDGIKQTGSLQVYNENSLITPTDSNRNPIDLPQDGVSMSYKMAELLDVSVGDEVEWHIQGQNKTVTTKIDAIYNDPTTQGLIISEDHFEDLGFNFTPTSIVTAEKVNDSYDEIKAINTMDSITTSWDDMTESMMTMVYCMIFFAAILSIVVLYNLGLLSFTEIEREIATLKVLGFKNSKLRTLLLTQNLWFTTIGFIIGVPVGYYVLEYMMATAGDSYYFPVSISAMNFFLSLIIAFGLSIFVNLLFSSKIKNLDMVESLKGNE